MLRTFTVDSTAARWALIFGIGIMAAVVIGPIFLSPAAISLNDDWTQIFAFQAYLHDTLLTIGELPERSHMLGSGFPINGHPEYPIFSPLTPLVLVAGPIVGTKLITAVVFIFGVLGMWLLCRQTLLLGVGASAFASAAFATTGWFPAILMSGNYPQIYYYWFPLIAWLVLVRPGESAGNRPWARLCVAGLLGATALSDGHLNTACVLLMVGLWSSMNGREGIIRGAALGVLTTLLGLYKLVPTAALLRIEDRAIDASTGLEIASGQLDYFTGLSGSVVGFSLGWVPWIALLGAVLVWRKSWPIIAMLLIATLLYHATNAPLDLFALLHRLPGFNSMDAPSKYFVFFIGFFAIVGAAVGLQQVPIRVRLPVALVATLVTAIPLWSANQSTFAEIFTEPDLDQVSRPYETLDTEYFVGDEWTGPGEQRPDLYVYHRKAIPLARWEDNFQLPPVASVRWNLANDGTLTDTPDYPGEVWLEPAAGTAVLVRLDANHLHADLTLASDSGPNTLQTGQRYDVGWGCGDMAIENRSGRLAIEVPAQTHEVRCRYRSRSVRYGALGSALTLGCIGLFFGLRWRRKRQ